MLTLSIKRVSAGDGMYEGGTFSGEPEIVREIMTGRYAVIVCDPSLPPGGT